MEQLPLVMISLFLTCVSMSAILFMAWRALGGERHALTWSIAFAVSSVQWAFNVAWETGWLTNNEMYLVIVNLAGSLTPVLGVAGYRQRAKKHIYLPLMSGIVLAAWGTSLWFAFLQPHAGISHGVLPITAACMFLWTAWILYNVAHDKRSIEWASVAGYLLFTFVEASIAGFALIQGAEFDAGVMAQYQTIFFVTRPTLVVVLGLLALSIFVADLAKRAQDLADYQTLKRKEETEKTWGTLQDAIEAISDVIVIDDGKGVIVTCNNAFANLLKTPKENLVGMRTLDLFDLYSQRFVSVDGEPIETAQQVIQKFWHALTTGARIDVVSHDNKNYIVDVAYLRTGGQVLVGRDVTQLFRARTRLEAAVNSLPIGFAFFDQNNQLVACNQNYEKIHQQDQGWIAQQSIEKLTGNIIRRLETSKSASLVERSSWLHDAVDAIESRKAVNFVSKLDDGRWYELVMEPVEEGGFVTLASDITNRRLLELDLEKNEAQLREILGNQPFPVIVISKEKMLVLFASRAAAEVLSNIDADLRGYRVGDFIPDIESLSANEAELREVRLSKKNGNTFPALISSQDIKYSGKEARVISFIDITNIHELTSELATQRQALFQSEKLNALGTLLAGVAHELNNPLTVVVANAHVLGMSSDDEAMQARIEKITNAADRCSKIVRSFLDIARKSPGEKVSFDVLKCVEQALEISSFGLQEHSITVDVNLAKNLPALDGDPDQFSQAVINLVINAQQALIKCEQPRKITVSAKLDKTGEKIEIHVADNGPGIPEDIEGRIFEPFFSTKKVGEGTGMGLSLVHSIVRAQGGDIELVKSQKGAHFKISVPHSGRQVNIISADKEEKVRLSAQHVLIVDDEPDVLEALSDILILQGHSVVAAGSGAEALQAMASDTFDCVLSDLRMPEMDGPQLYATIQKKFPDMRQRVGFITGNNLSDHARDFLDSCGQPSIGKPFLPEDIALLIDTLCDQ